MVLYRALFPIARYMCEAKTTFYLDTTSVEHNYWGSSMSANHVDTKKSGHQAVTVPTVNVMKAIPTKEPIARAI